MMLHFQEAKSLWMNLTKRIECPLKTLYNQFLQLFSQALCLVSGGKVKTKLAVSSRPYKNA